MADVLFIDLNNVELEINVAREAAKQRGEKLIVLPLNRNNYKDPARSKLNQQWNEVGQRYQRFCYNDVVNTEKCDKAKNDEVRIMREMEKLPPQIKYDAAKLKEELTQIKENVSSVMISGHDGGGSFHGEFGEIEGQQFLDTLKGYAGRDNIRSLYLLGCNSATTHTFGSLWKAALLNAAFIAGYEGIGYLRDNALGHNFIRKAMAEEKNILASINMTEALKKFRNVSPKIQSMERQLVLY